MRTQNNKNNLLKTQHINRIYIIDLKLFKQENILTMIH